MATINLSGPARKRWTDTSFYKDDLVLGIDIGLSYIGLCLRLGPKILVAETVVYSARASLEARRLKRHWRRNRKAADHRIFLLRRFCLHHGLPWLELGQWQQAMEPAFRLRLKAEEKPGSLTPLELVVCLRHILQRRGYDWHRLGDLGETFPWGDGKPLSRECKMWLENQYLTTEVASSVRATLPPDMDEESLQHFDTLLGHAVARSENQGMVQHLREHARDPFVVRAKGRNFPREVLEAHSANLLRGHANCFKKRGLESALSGFQEIINHHRKDQAAQAAHWEKKAGRCPFTNEACAPMDEEHAKQFRLLEFLATRRFAVAPRVRSPLPPTFKKIPAAVIAWLLQHPKGQAEPIPASGDLRKQFEARVCGEDEKLASDKSTLNGNFFSQLRDILYRRTGAASRAALSVNAARDWYNKATANGICYEPAEIIRVLKPYYDKRREASLAQWFHPHVEFLIGPRAYLLKQTTVPKKQIHGWLNRLMVRPNVAEKLKAAGHTAKPDYVIIEVVSDIPRTSAGRQKIEAEQKERRAARDELITRYGLDKSNENALLRTAMWEQQGGSDTQPARCPLTGLELRGGPLARNLELAHIYPRTWGGPFLRDNLFLTTKEVNDSMNDNPPAQCVGYSAARVGMMRWPEGKRTMFTTAWLHPSKGTPPEWGMNTRVAQLARQLRDAMRIWLGLNDENEMTRRVATVSGFFTAQCRKIWLEDYRKDRSDLRNHLYDAMVLTHIPPGIGLNSVGFGGIFETTERQLPDGSRMTSYAPPAALGPDWRAFDAAHKYDCLILRPRSRAPKTKRFDETIYGIEREVRNDKKGKPEKGPRLRVREVITSGGWPVPDAEKWFLAAEKRHADFASLFPEKLWRAWLEENAQLKASGSNEPKPLQFPGHAPVRTLRVDASKPQFFDPSAVAAHGTGGVKNPTERNLALDLYTYTTANGKTKVVTRAVPHPRFKKLQAKWVELGQQLIELEPLPEGSKRVARFTKGQLFLVPLSKNGEIALDLDCAYARVWCHITALKSDGQVVFNFTEFNVSEIKTDKNGIVVKEGSRLYGLKLKDYRASGDSLLNLFNSQR